MDRFKPYFKYIFSAVGFLIFIVVALRALDDALIHIREIKVAYFLSAMLCQGMSIAVQGDRLRFVMKQSEIAISLKQAVILSFACEFFNSLAPSFVGGDIAKAYLASNATNGKIQALACVFIDRILGLMGLIVMGIVSVIGWWKGSSLILILLIFISSLLLMVLCIPMLRLISSGLAYFLGLLGWQRLYHIAISLHETVMNYKFSVWFLWGGTFYSLVSKALSVLAVWFLFAGIDTYVSIWAISTTVAVSFIASLLPSLNGLGIREASFVLQMAQLVRIDAATGVSLLWMLTFLVPAFIGGIIWLTYYLRGKPLVERLDPEKISRTQDTAP